MLKAWRTPFETEQFPSVWITCPAELAKLRVFIGLPAQWQVRFQNVVGVKICDETYDNNARFHIERDVDGLCSYTWENSPWLDDFNSEYVEVMNDSKLTHYVLLGGDHNVEILAYGEVTTSDASVT